MNSQQTPPPPSNTPPQKLNEDIVTLTEAHKLGNLFESLLKKPLSLAEHIRSSKLHSQLNLSFLMVTALCLVVYGITLGSFAMHEQLWASPLKILLGTLFSVLICFPSLYIFTCLTGTHAGVKQIFAGLLGTLSLMGILLVGFAPILWVFAQSTHSLGFMGVLMLASWLISFCFAIGFLKKLLLRCGAARFRSLYVWAGIFLLVSLQMSTSLRPIIGRSDTLLTNEKRFFIQHWINSASETIEQDDHKSSAK